MATPGILRYPVLVLVPLSFVCAVFGLGLGDNPLALVVLLTQLIVLLEVATARETLVKVVIAEAVSIALGATVPLMTARRAAHRDDPAAAFFIILVVMGFVTLWTLFLVSTSTWFGSRMRSSALRCLLLPLLWTLGWMIFEWVSPFGRQLGWTPQGGLLTHYEWLLPTFGQPSLDFVVATLANCLALLVLPSLHLRFEPHEHVRMPGGYGAISPSERSDERDGDERAPLIRIPPRQLMDRPSKYAARWTLAVLGIFSLPGQLRAPSALQSWSSQRVTLGCALPPTRSGSGAVPYAYWRQESTELANRGAKVIIWPEAALAINHRFERMQLLANVSKFASERHVYVGVTYTGTAWELGIEQFADQQKVSAMTLLGEGQDTIFTYAKPIRPSLAESFAFRPFNTSAPSASIRIPSRQSESGEAIAVSAAMGSDPSFPELLEPAGEAALLLVPTSSWSPELSWTAMHGTVAWRAIERRLGIFVCDGGSGGVSGYIDEWGRIKYWQGASRGSFALSVTLPTVKPDQTLYGFYGNICTIFLLVVIVACAWSIECLWTGFDEEWDAVRHAYSSTRRWCGEHRDALQEELHRSWLGRLGKRHREESDDAEHAEHEA